MRSTIFAAVLAFAASALAQDATPGYAVVSAPGKDEVVPSGKTYTIQWSAGKFTGPATISLMGGNDPSTLVVLDPIATGIDVKDESFSWAVACSLGKEKTYGLKIADQATDGATFQYSFPFEIKGPSCDGTSSSSATSASASATSSAAGYPTKSSSTLVDTVTSGYPVATSTASTTSSSSSTKVVTSTSAPESSSTSVSKPTTTLVTSTTPVATVTGVVSVSSSTSSTPASATTSALPIPTAGATRAGAGLALGLLAAALAL
ncbi:Ser-Thr-rich glycosyl-phosphatidyl-inositol-anchored membrane family-domain-containing protein [Xylaria palmicola]|nr:Ser-Thr-rich glycosyl-phosphatidyl-inositol-anchored membrane family-domain-containing protein [Xylaria palmicola]